MAGRYERELAVAIEAAQAAGDAIRDLYERSAAATYTKGDGSPVTDADLAADQIIRARLQAAFPDDALLTEEGADDAARLANRRVWIVDPIDGTQQFVDRTGEFDVLIALVVEQRPVAGVILQPTTGEFFAAAEGAGAWKGVGSAKERFELEPVAADASPLIAASVWLNMPAATSAIGRVVQRIDAAEPFVSPYGVTVRHLTRREPRWDVLIGPPSRTDQTMAWEWDFAAADIVVREAGGAFTDAWGRRFDYNKPVPRNQGGLLIAVDPNTHRRVLDALAPELPT